MLQMVGRKRLHRKETVNVYIMVPPDIDKELSKDKAKIKELRDFLDDIKKNPYTVQNNWGSISEEKQKLLVQQNLRNEYGQLAMVFVPNPLAEMKLKIEQGRIEDLKRQCEGNEFGVQKAILEWFENAPEFSQEMVMSNRPVDCSELTEYIESCIKDEKIINKDARKEELSHFSERYTAITKEKLKNGNDVDRISNTISNALSELGLPYSFKKQIQAITNLNGNMSGNQMRQN